MILLLIPTKKLENLKTLSHQRINEFLMIGRMKHDCVVITESCFEYILTSYFLPTLSFKISDFLVYIIQHKTSYICDKKYFFLINCKSCDDIFVINTLFASRLSLGNILSRQKVTIISNTYHTGDLYRHYSSLSTGSLSTYLQMLLFSCSNCQLNVKTPREVSTYIPFDQARDDYH